MRGACLCGQIAFELVGEKPKFYQCHCSLCRKQGGSTSNSATIVPAADLHWLRGAEKIHSWVKESGFRSDFCSCCGSPVPNPLGNAAYYWVPAGLLDDDAGIEICAHLFVGSKAAWDVIAAPGVQFDTMPALAEVLALLHAR